jgi:hypothetical protein
MALGDPYADLGALMTRLGTDDALTAERVLDTASRAVEAFTRRQFNKTTSATARRFRPVDWRRVPVDDFHTVTGLAVSVNGTAWNVANVDPRPRNGIVNGQTGWPFYDLFATVGSWPCDATVTVTAQWGWPAVPKGIEEATLETAAVMFAAGGGGSSYPIVSESVAGYAVRYQPPTGLSSSDDVPSEMASAAPYRRRWFGVA